MTFRELEIFFALSELNHTALVASRLKLSQSAVSLAMKSLEKKIGEELFDRIGKSIILNERGKYFKNLTKPHYDALLEAGAVFKKEAFFGELSIAASRTIGDYIMPQALFDFKAEYPTVDIINTTNNSKEIVGMILNGSVNIGFIESKIENKQISMQKLCSDELVVVTKDRKLKEEEVYIDNLTDYIWLLREEGSGTREIFLKEIDKNKKQLKKLLVFSSFESIKRVLKQNKEAITCISRLCVEEDIKKGILYEVKLKNFSFKRDFYLIYHKNKYKNRLFREFCTFCQDYFMDT
jgi:DNA-binding transcriptional LysR family regulator